MKSIKELMGLEEADKMKGEDPCWDTHQMVGMKMKNGRKVPNCVPKAKPKNEEVEIAEAKVGDTVSFHHELKSAPGSKVKKSGTVEKVDGDVVHVKVKDKYGVKRHQIKMGDLVKEETEQIDEMDKSAPQPGRDGKVSHRTYGSRDRDDKDDYFKGKESPGKSVTAKQAEKDALKILNKQYAKEETQIDELNKDTVYSYNKKADADVEKKHKSLGQLMRKGDASGANKAAHQINRRLAGMERAETRLNKEETELEEAQFWGNKEMAKQANAASGSTTTMRGRDAKGVYTATLVRKKGESEHKEVSRVYDTKEEFESIDEVSKELANRVSAARRKQADDSSKKDPYLKPSAETVEKKKKADDAHASWIKRMHRDNNRGKTQADISREHAAAADYNSKRGWTNEEIELEEAEEVKKAKMTPQERAYKRKLGLKAVVGTVQEAVKKMKDKKGDPSQTKNVKKGEPLSGKQEPIKVNPELQEK